VPDADGQDLVGREAGESCPGDIETARAEPLVERATARGRRFRHQCHWRIETMWVKHDVKGVRNVSLNVGRAMIKAGVAVACDEKGAPAEAPKATGKRAQSNRKGN